MHLEEGQSYLCRDGSEITLKMSTSHSYLTDGNLYYSNGQHGNLVYGSLLLPHPKDIMEAVNDNA